ncbi:hypothetical protein [Rhizobium sp. JAB6]|uniref:hypothetical protein n=1 Tax=Rhizobium sp. JAB6 TaxID=2127050 RepID=UPI0015E7CF3F|nr:hypothetical protein [Rhizobium sp. JAB6]
MDHAKFFAAARSSLFGGRPSANQVDGMEAILAAWRAAPFDMRWLPAASCSAWMIGSEVKPYTVSGVANRSRARCVTPDVAQQTNDVLGDTFSR